MTRGAAHYQTLTRRDLSRRQREVLELIAEGRTNGEIAARLGISLDGAKWHVSEILGKLEVGTREEAAAWWRTSPRFGNPVAAMARAIGPLASWRFAGPAFGAAAAGALIVGVLFLANLDRGDVLPKCTVDDVILEPVEAHSPPLSEVVIALTARARERDCKLQAIAMMGLEAEPDQMIHDSNISAQTDRVLTPARVAVAYLRWTSSCEIGGARVDVIGSLLNDSGPSKFDAFASAGPLFVVNAPSCDSPGTAVPSLSFRVEAPGQSNIAPELGPDPFDAIYCYPTDGSWLKPCEVVDKVWGGLNAKNVDVLLEWAELRPYTCPEPGSGGLGGPSFLCEGAPAGEVRSGIPVAFHGSEGDVYSLVQLKASFEALIEGGRIEPGRTLFTTRPATVACFPDAPDCSRFAIGIANDGSPAAAYLVFRVDGEALRLTSVGFAGENALIFRRGGEARFGEDGTLGHFIPIVVPY